MTRWRKGQNPCVKSNYVTAFLIVIALISAVLAPAQSNDKEAEVRSTIEAFCKAFDDGFTSPADYAAEDWNHTNPLEAGPEDGKQFSKRFGKSTNPS